jgi:tricorn protease
VKPCLVVLSNEEASPFVPRVHGFAEDESKPATEKTADVKVRVDTDHIERRILAFPVPEGIYRQIAGLPEKVLFTSFAVSGSLNTDWTSRDMKTGELQCFDFLTQKCEAVLDDILTFKISHDSSALVYRSGRRLRAVSTAGKIKKPTDNKPSRQSGWIDLSRAKVSVEPRAEWRQMFRDVWRLQREYFWVEDMSGVDW